MKFTYLQCILLIIIASFLTSVFSSAPVSTTCHIAYLGHTNLIQTLEIINMYISICVTSVAD